MFQRSLQMVTHLVLNTLGLLFIQVLLNVFGIHHRHNAVQSQLPRQVLILSSNTEQYCQKCFGKLSAQSSRGCLGLRKIYQGEMRLYCDSSAHYIDIRSCLTSKRYIIQLPRVVEANHEKCLSHRCRVSQACCLDQDVIESLFAGQQILEGDHKISTDCRTNAGFVLTRQEPRQESSTRLSYCWHTLGLIIIHC